MAQIPFSPPQTQAALQNPVRFPDQRLQQYARGQQPTGQVTPQMAQQEMATRGQERQAFQRQQAMQNNPANSPTIFQQKDMELQQARQALQQKEQQLGIVSALMAKQAQDLQTREQGIATLPTRPDMFTAMDGGIVFSRGGGVLGFKSGGNKGEMDRDDDSVEADVPSTTGTPTGKLDPLQEIMAARRRITESGDKTMLSDAGKKELRDQRIAEMAAEFAEYEKGSAGREARMAEALRGQKPELMDFLGAMAAGGPKRTLGETLSAMVPGTQKLRAEQQARDMAAAKYLAEAEEKTAQAVLAEKRGQRAAADKLIQEAQADRLKAFEVKKGVEDTGIRALTSVAEAESRERSEARRAQEAADRMALEREKFKSDEAYRAGEREFKEKMVRLEASLRPKEFYNQLLGMATNPKDPNYEFAKNLLEARGGRSGAGADGRPTFDQISDNVEKRMQGTDINKIIKAAAKDPKNPRTLTEADIREMFFDEEIARAEKYYGKDVFKGMKPSKSSDAGAVDTSNPLLSGKP
jgi:hypothetical protein